MLYNLAFWLTYLKSWVNKTRVTFQAIVVTIGIYIVKIDFKMDAEINRLFGSEPLLNAVFNINVLSKVRHGTRGLPFKAFECEIGNEPVSAAVAKASYLWKVKQR